MKILSRPWLGTCLALGAGCLLIGCRRGQEPGEAGELTAVPVRTVAVQQSDLTRHTSQPATVHAFFETDIRARVSGYVVNVAADIGEMVRAGQTLVEIDVPELKQRRETLRAEIDLSIAGEQAAEAGVQLARASVRSAEAKLAQANSELARVEASLKAAESEFRRTQDLVNRGSLQGRILDEVTQRRDAELAARDAVRSAVVAAEAEVAVAEAEQARTEASLRSAEAQTAVAKQNLAELEVEIDFAVVHAPFQGLVTERNVNLGDLIMDDGLGRNAKPMYVLQQVDKLRIRIPVPESQAVFVQTDDAVQLRFPSFASEPPMEARVTRFAGSLDPSTRTMIVEAEIENSDSKLMPGMFGESTIEFQTKALATKLPSRAVRFSEDGAAYVYIVDEDDRVQVTQVIPGADTGTEMVILSGVEPGQRVIGPHLRRFTDGQLVEPL